MTKELLSKILEIEVSKIKDEIKSYSDLLFFETTDIETKRKNSPSLPSINIYELSHKCKSYVVRNSGWTLQSYTNERGAGICRVKVGDGQEINKFIDVSEADAVFKATEWGLEQLKNKGKLNEMHHK